MVGFGIWGLVNLLIRDLLIGDWNLVLGIWCLVLGACGAWNLLFMVCCIASGVHNRYFVNRSFSTRRINLVFPTRYRFHILLGSCRKR